jgi:hypothetical protein
MTPANIWAQYRAQSTSAATACHACTASRLQALQPCHHTVSYWTRRAEGQNAPPANTAAWATTHVGISCMHSVPREPGCDPRAYASPPPPNSEHTHTCLNSTLNTIQRAAGQLLLSCWR